MSEVALEPEFSLLVQCCRWNFATADEGSRPHLPANSDWSRFIQLARRHRVQGLAWAALAPNAEVLPEHARAALSSEARLIAATNLAIAAECSQLREMFERSNASLLFIKGLTVGVLAYRAPLLKMGWDIDLLIDPNQLEIAADLLTERGFAPRLPASRLQLQSWHAKSKESVWHKNDSLYVELHTRLADHRQLIPRIDVHSTRQEVQVTPNAKLPTLAQEELFAYLAVHGASSAWFRLKWISDFAALLHGRDGEEIGQLYRRSQELGSGRAAGQALLLADRLFGTLQPIPALRGELESDRATRLLCRTALRMMSDGTCEPTERLLGTLPIHRTQFLLLPGLRFKCSELMRQTGSLFRR